MRVISKFKDYYDGAIGYGGIDKTTVYVRTHEEIELSKSPHRFHNRHSVRWGNRYTYGSYDWEMQTGSLFFCGKEYPYYQFDLGYDETVDKNGYPTSTHGDRIIETYFGGVHDEEMKKLFVKKRQKTLGKFHTPDDFYSEVVKTHLECHKTDYNEIHLEYECPVIDMRRGLRNRDVVITKNPCLKDFGFARIINPFEAFQEINMYMNGPLCSRKEIEPEPLAEKYSVLRHGMDKWSFRRKSLK